MIQITFFSFFLLAVHGYTGVMEAPPRWIVSKQYETSEAPRLALVVGCGDGRSIPNIQEHHPHHVIVGTDFDADKIAEARQNFPDRIFIHARAGEEIFFPDVFDFVKIEFAMSVLPYDEKPSMIRQLHRILKKNGKLYIRDYNDVQSTCNIISKMRFEIECRFSKDEFTYFSFEKK
jgi:ubiquinone/menaquinone biosynthesis C-methylase UbiE